MSQIRDAFKYIHGASGSIPNNLMDCTETAASSSLYTAILPKRNECAFLRKTVNFEKFPFSMAPNNSLLFLHPCPWGDSYRNQKRACQFLIWERRLIGVLVSYMTFFTLASLEIDLFQILLTLVKTV